MTSPSDQIIRDTMEDGVRTGIGMCIRLMDIAIENLPAEFTAAEALTRMRDTMREASAEFSLDAAGA